MLRRAVWAAVWGGAAVLLGSTVAHAQCTKDVDCKGDRVCEAGKCTSPLPPAPPPPPSAEVKPEAVTLDEDAAAATSAPDAAPANAAAPADSAAPQVDAEPDTAPQQAPAAAVASLGSDEPQVRRRSRGMMVGGIVMASVGPLALLGALSARNSQENCDEALQNRYPDHMVPSNDASSLSRCDSYTVPIYVLGIGGAVLLAAGVPMIIYGAKSVPSQPVARAQLLPWAGPGSGGLRLRLDL